MRCEAVEFPSDVLASLPVGGVPFVIECHWGARKLALRKSCLAFTAAAHLPAGGCINKLLQLLAHIGHTSAAEALATYALSLDPCHELALDILSQEEDTLFQPPSTQPESKIYGESRKARGAEESLTEPVATQKDAGTLGNGAMDVDAPEVGNAERGEVPGSASGSAAGAEGGPGRGSAPDASAGAVGRRPGKGHVAEFQPQQLSWRALVAGVARLLCEPEAEPSSTTHLHTKAHIQGSEEPRCSEGHPEDDWGGGEEPLGWASLGGRMVRVTVPPASPASGHSMDAHPGVTPAVEEGASGEKGAAVKGHAAPTVLHAPTTPAAARDPMGGVAGITPAVNGAAGEKDAQLGDSVPTAPAATTSPTATIGPSDRDAPNISTVTTGPTANGSPMQGDTAVPAEGAAEASKELVGEAPGRGAAEDTKARAGDDNNIGKGDSNTLGQEGGAGGVSNGAPSSGHTSDDDSDIVEVSAVLKGTCRASSSKDHAPEEDDEIQVVSVVLKGTRGDSGTNNQAPEEGDGIVKVTELPEKVKSKLTEEAGPGPVPSASADWGDHMEEVSPTQQDEVLPTQPNGDVPKGRLSAGEAVETDVVEVQAQASDKQQLASAETDSVQPEANQGAGVQGAGEGDSAAGLGELASEEIPSVPSPGEGADGSQAPKTKGKRPKAPAPQVPAPGVRAKLTRAAAQAQAEAKRGEQGLASRARKQQKEEVSVREAVGLCLIGLKPGGASLSALARHKLSEAQDGETGGVDGVTGGSVGDAEKGFPGGSDGNTEEAGSEVSGSQGWALLQRLQGKEAVILPAWRSSTAENGQTLERESSRGRGGPTGAGAGAGRSAVAGTGPGASAGAGAGDATAGAGGGKLEGASQASRGSVRSLIHLMRKQTEPAGGAPADAVGPTRAGTPPGSTQAGRQGGGALQDTVGPPQAGAETALLQDGRQGAGAGASADNVQRGRDEALDSDTWHGGARAPLVLRAALRALEGEAKQEGPVPEERDRVNAFLRQVEGPREAAVLAWHLLEALAGVPNITAQVSASRDLAVAVLFLVEQSRGVKAGQRSPECCLFLGEVHLLLAEQGDGTPGQGTSVEGVPGDAGSGDDVVEMERGTRENGDSSEAEAVWPGECQWYAKGGLFHLMRFVESQLVGGLPARQLAQLVESHGEGPCVGEGDGDQWVELSVPVVHPPPKGGGQAQGQGPRKEQGQEGAQKQGQGTGSPGQEEHEGFAQTEECRRWLRSHWGVARAWLLLGDEKGALAHLRRCREWAKQGAKMAPMGAQVATEKAQVAPKGALVAPERAQVATEGVRIAGASLIDRPRQVAKNLPPLPIPLESLESSITALERGRKVKHLLEALRSHESSACWGTPGATEQEHLEPLLCGFEALLQRTPSGALSGSLSDDLMGTTSDTLSGTVSLRITPQEGGRKGAGESQAKGEGEGEVEEKGEEEEEEGGGGFLVRGKAGVWIQRGQVRREIRALERFLDAVLPLCLTKERHNQSGGKSREPESFAEEGRGIQRGRGATLEPTGPQQGSDLFQRVLSAALRCCALALRLSLRCLADSQTPPQSQSQSQQQGNGNNRPGERTHSERGAGGKEWKGEARSDGDGAGVELGMEEDCRASLVHVMHQVCRLALSEVRIRPSVFPDTVSFPSVPPGTSLK